MPFPLLRRIAVVVVMVALTGIVAVRGLGGVGVGSAGGGGAVPVEEAAELVLRQLAALRAHDFAAAYALASRELRRNFSRGEFEWMMKRAHPEIANSVYAFVVRTHEADGFLYITAKVHGKNGKNVEALYEVVREAGTLKVNALSCRHDDGVL